MLTLTGLHHENRLLKSYNLLSELLRRQKLPHRSHRFTARANFLTMRDPFLFQCTTLSVLLGQKEHFALSLTVCVCSPHPPLTARGVFSPLDAACSSLCGMYLSAYACNIFPLVQKDAPRRGEGARDRGTECELGFLSLFWKEYFKGLLHVIQLPRMKAPGKQDQLIIHQPHVPGRQQYHYHLKLPTRLYFCSGPKHSRPVNTFFNIL